MNLLDNKNLKILLKELRISKIDQDVISKINSEIKIYLEQYKKRKKNYDRKQKLDAQEKTYNVLKTLSKKEIDSLPEWIKKDLKTCKIIGNSKKVIMNNEGKKFHLNNSLNDLPGNEWSFFLRSVINTRYPTSGKEGYAHQIRKIHPSPKPPQLMQDIINFFTKENELVFDYFMGVGGTLLGASLAKRKALGIDLNSKYINAYKKASKELNLEEQVTIKGDSLQILKNNKIIYDYLKKDLFSLIAIDPPYGDMMSREKTGEAIKANKSTAATPFTENKKDLGNMSWDKFKKIFIESIELSMPFLKDRGHFVVFIKDLQPKDGMTNLLHADIIEEMNKIKNLNYLGMKIWADESINLYPYGYPYSFVSNQLHQYIMIFRKKL